MTKKEYNHDYFQKNKDKIYCKHREWIERNKEQQKEYHKHYQVGYYLKNKEKTNLKSKNYAISHRSEMVRNTRKWQINNLERYKNYNKKYGVSLSGYFRRYKSSAKKRELAMNINLDNFRELISKPCNYCGENEKQRGIDRVDNSIGYIKENSVSCCKTCNFMKKTMTKEEFLNHINKIYNFNKKQK
jgi:hypothetical protein